MENQDKKRFSILKKSSTDDPPTPTVTKSNRRISFCDRKSVKEFMAGEDKATIWGTSYEEEDNGTLAENQNLPQSEGIIATKIPAMSSNPSIGMQLRNKKVVYINSSKPSTSRSNKENIAIVPEDSNDTVDLTESIQFGACTYDNRTFNGTVDITLNSFELKNWKFRRTVQSCDGRIAESEPDLDTSPEFYTSLININEKERENVLQNKQLEADVVQIPQGGNQRQTLIFNNTETLDESLNTNVPAKSSIKSRKESLIFTAGKDSDMQIETDLVAMEDGKPTTSSTSTLKQQVNRQTLILNQRCDIDEAFNDPMHKNIEKSLPVNRETIIFNQGNELEQSQVFDSNLMQDKQILPVPQTTRQTIFFDEKPDLDLSNQGNLQNQLNESNSVKQKKDRPTLLFKNCDLDLSLGSGKKQVDSKLAKNTYQSLIEDIIESEQVTDSNISIFERIRKKRSNENHENLILSTGDPLENQRRTIIFDKNERLNEEHLQSAGESMQAAEKQTVFFGRESGYLDLTMGNTNTSKNYGSRVQEKSKQRRTIVFEKPEGMDETLVENLPTALSIEAKSSPMQQIPDHGATLVFNSTKDPAVCGAIPKQTISNERTFTEQKVASSKQNSSTIWFEKSLDLGLTFNDCDKLDVNAQTVNTSNQRRTVIFDNPETLDETSTELGHFKAIASNWSASKVRQPSHEDSDMEVDNDLGGMEDTNQTVNKDRSATTTLSWPSLKSQNSTEKQFIKIRQTLILDQKCDIDESLTDFPKYTIQPELAERSAKFQEIGSACKTIVFDQPQNLEETQLVASKIHEKIVPRTVHSTLPKTVHATRQTILFNEGNDLDLTMGTGSPFKNDEINNPVLPAKRETLIFNKTATLDQSLCDRTTHHSIENPSIITEENKQNSKRNRATILFNKASDLDLTMPSNQTDVVTVQTAKIANQRRTVIFDDFEFCEEAMASARSADKSLIDVNDHCDMEIEVNSMDRQSNPIAQQSMKNRQTLIFDQRCDMDETLSDSHTPEMESEISKKRSQVKELFPDRKTKIFNQSHDIEETQVIGSKFMLRDTISTKPIAPKARHTIFSNKENDCPETDMKNPENHSQSVLTSSVKRKKFPENSLCKKNFDLDLTLEDRRVVEPVNENVTRSAIFDRSKTERTAENNLSWLERIRKNRSNENSILSTRDQPEIQRRTIIFGKNEKLGEDHLELDQPAPKNRRTVLFGSESDELDLTMETSMSSKNYGPSLQQNVRRTVIFETPESLEETNVRIEKHRKFNKENNFPVEILSNLQSPNTAIPKIFQNKIIEDFPEGNQSNRNTSTKKTGKTFDNVVEIVDDTIIDCTTQSFNVPHISQNNCAQEQEASSRSVIEISEISGIENLDITTRHIETLSMRRQSTINFENKSLNTTERNSKRFSKLTRDSIFLNETVHCEAAAGASLQMTPSSSAFSPNTTEALCNIDPSKITGTGYNRNLSKNSNLEDLTINIHDDIEKTQLDLIESFTINTTADASLLEVYDRSQQTSPVCNASQLLLNDSVGNRSKDGRLNAKNISKKYDFCRKCKNCRRSINFNGDDTTISDFLLKQEEELTLNFDCLKELKGKPRIIDILNEMKDQQDELERQFAEIELNELNESIIFPTVPSIDFLLKNYTEGFEQQLREAQELNYYIRPYLPLIPTFEFLFKNKLETEENCDWFFNDLHLPAGLLECRHKTIRSIRVLIFFTAQELFKPNASKLNFDKITLSRCPIYKNLTPFDTIVQNDIFSKLPRDVTVMCNSSNELFDFLNRLHKMCIKSHELGKSLWNIVAMHEGTLHKDESGRCIIKKVLRDPMAVKLGIKKLQIHVRDIEKIAWHDIEVPDSRRFSEDIESLLIGLDFLATFLNNPVKYFK